MKRPYSMSNRAAAAAAAAAANTAAALNKSLFNSDALSGHIGRTFFAPPPYSPYVVPRKLYFAWLLIWPVSYRAACWTGAHHQTSSLTYTSAHHSNFNALQAPFRKTSLSTQVEFIHRKTNSFKMIITRTKRFKSFRCNRHCTNLISPINRWPVTRPCLTVIYSVSAASLSSR
jgi:hypothetical protein